MCSQRSALFTRRRKGRLRRTRTGATSLALLSATVLNARSRNLLVARNLERQGLHTHLHLLLHELIAAVLARRFNEHAIGTLLHHLAAIVTAIPHHRVLAGQPRGA